MHKSHFSIKPFIPPSSTLVYQGARFNVHHLKKEGLDRDVIIHPGSVVILPILNQKQVVLIKNERFAIGESLWELPAGTLEKEETPQDCARRELQEETGYYCKEVSPLITFYTSPGYTNEKMFAYAAHDLEKGCQHLDDAETISVSDFSFREVEAMIKDGRICDAKTIAVLLYYLFSQKT